MVDKIYLGHDYYEDMWRLSAAVRRGGWQPDVLIGLWRGGAPVGIAMHEFLYVTGWKVRHYPLKCSSYTGIGQQNGGVLIECAEPLFAALRPGDHVLVVDDVFDSGRTFAAIKARLDTLGVEMRSASVYWKPKRNLTTLKPDYYVRTFDSEWLVYPHEIDGLTDEELVRKDPFLADLLKEFRGA